MKRTFYFLSRNGLAMVGLAILIFFAALALYSFTYTAVPYDSMVSYCGTDTGNGFYQPNCQVCTYDPNLQASAGLPAGWKASNCYEVNGTDAALVPPTVDFGSLHPGPLPLGSLAALPSGSHFYSIYDGIVKGAPWSLGISVAIVGSGALIGLVLGSVAGYFGGYTDELIMRIVDIFLSIPGLLLALVMIQVFGTLSIFTSLFGRVELLILAFIITFWPFYTRLVRSQVLVTREQKFVEASRASGATSGRILRRHIIPNSVYPILVQLSLDVGTIPLGLGGLTFLGFHVFPSTFFPEWGNVTANAVSLGVISSLIQVNPNPFPWWQILFPGLTLFMYAISVNFLSDGIRDALDPRLRR
jgi:peptide/nickel transport system permease protein